MPTLPGVSEAQVLEALEIARRVYAEHGATATIEPRIYRDPEDADLSLQLRAFVTVEISFDLHRNLIHAVPSALRLRGLYEPAIPLTVHLVVDW